MKRAVGTLVVLGLIGSAVWIGLAVGSSRDASTDPDAARFLEKVPDVVGMEMDEAIRELNSVAIDVETWHQGTVTEMQAGTVNGSPAFVVLVGTEPGPHRCPTWFNSCPIVSPEVVAFVDPGTVDGPIYEYSTTVLDDGTGQPMLCVGAIMTSLPPQCGGPPIVNWDWSKVDGEEQRAGIVWDAYLVTGRFDGENFAVLWVESQRQIDRDDDKAQRPPSRRYPRGALRKIQFYLSGGPAADRFGYDMTWSSVDKEDKVVELGVVIAMDDTRRMLDERYGRGVIRLFPELHPVED